MPIRFDDADQSEEAARARMIEHNRNLWKGERPPSTQRADAAVHEDADDDSEDAARDRMIEYNSNLWKNAK